MRSITGVRNYPAVSCECCRRNEICPSRAQKIGVTADKLHYRSAYYSCLMQAPDARAATQNHFSSLRPLHAQPFENTAFRPFTLRIDRQFWGKCIYSVQGKSIFFAARVGIVAAIILFFAAIVLFSSARISTRIINVLTLLYFLAPQRSPSSLRVALCSTKIV